MSNNREFSQLASNIVVNENSNFIGIATGGNYSVGIGTTNASPKLYVVGDGYFTGILTANRIFSSIYGEFTGGSISGSTIVGAALSVAGISTLGTVQISSGIITATSGVVTYYGDGSKLTNVTNVGVATYATTAGVATALQNSRTFEITGDVVASPIFFDGTGNVSLAATIQPNSVALGSDTTGDYVQSISGTSNQITVISGTGEGSTPTLSIPNQFTAPQDVTVTRDLQVNRNLNVTGNITIGGTSATIFSQSLNIFDPDIVLGYRTDAFGNDVSNDNTANHGGVAVASTEGTPLVQLFIAGIETNPATYKKIMWFKAGEFAGLGTDAWLFNYAVGIGSTQFPTGTRLAAGSVQFTENDLAVVRNINASGIITGTLTNTLTLNTSGTGLSGVATYNNSGAATFTVTSNATSNNTPSTIVARDASGNFSAGTITANLTGTASTASFATTAFNLSDAANITTGTINSARLSGTYNINISGISTYATNAGISTYATIAGISTYANTAGVSTSVIGDIASVTQLNVSGISTIGNFKVTPVGTGATVGGIGITYYGDGSQLSNIISGITIRDEGVVVGSSVTTLDFAGTNISASNAVGGISTVTVSVNYVNNAGIATYATSAGVSTSVIGGIGSITQLQVTGISTFSNGPVFIGAATSTGTAAQRLQVTGGAYVSGSVGVGTTNPRETLDVVGTIGVQGTGSANRFEIQHNTSLNSLDFIFV